MGTACLDFDSSIFSIEALLNTGYWCADKAVLEIKEEGKSYKVVLTSKDETELTAQFFDDFKTMLVHNQIRANLKNIFADIEKTIINRAFRPIAQVNVD